MLAMPPASPKRRLVRIVLFFCLALAITQGLRSLAFNSEHQSSGGPAAASFQNVPAAQPALRPAGPLRSKKGVGSWYHSTVGKCLKAAGVSWTYTWRLSAKDAGILPLPDGVEHVPMVWGASDTAPEKLAKASAEPGDCVLGFNEPDEKTQSNMTVDRVLELWPRLEKAFPGKRLGGPATAGKPLTNKWMQDFMKGVEERGLRVDFLPIHFFIGDRSKWEPKVAVYHMKTYLEGMWAEYKRPLWVTEWALTKWSSPATFPPVQQQAIFLKEASEMLNSLPFVERYAFFAIFPYRKNSMSQICEYNGTVTVLGKVYSEVD